MQILQTQSTALAGEVQSKVGHPASYIRPCIQDSGLSHRIRALKRNHGRKLLACRAIGFTEISFDGFSLIADLYALERRTSERLRELDRARSDFVAVVTHDLRTPLSVVRGYLDLFAEQTRKNKNGHGLPLAEATLQVEISTRDQPTTLYALTATRLLERSPEVMRLFESDPFAEGFYRAMGAVRVGDVPSGSIPHRNLPVLRFDLEAAIVWLEAQVGAK